MTAPLDSRHLLLAVIAAATAPMRPMALQHAMHALDTDLALLLDPATRFTFRDTIFGPLSTALFPAARAAAADGTVVIEEIPPTQRLLTCFSLSAAGRQLALEITRALPEAVQCRIAEIAAFVSAVGLAELNQERLPFPNFDPRNAAYRSAA